MTGFVFNRFFFGVGCRLLFGSSLLLGQASMRPPNADKATEQW
jgi:hypothetical protein